ncbi:hypothetical protein ACJJTC_013949 [Scirpophaga incertulas]
MRLHRRVVLVLHLTMATLAMARPEMYKEKEDFHYSRSSSDEGTKSGYYDAQRGNMGGNYERAHNMDTLAQHQMGGLVSQVEGELGDASKTRTGSVFTSSNSRGVYGSGHYDLSNLQGRNFQEGVSYGDSQALSSNSASNNARYRLNGHLSNSDYIRQQSNLGAQSSYGTNQFVQESQSGRTSKHYTHSAYEGSNSYIQGNTEEAANNFGSNTHNRLISTVPVKIIVRPGQRIAVPLATQTHSGSQAATYYDQNIANQQALDTISRSDSHYASHSDQNAINSNVEVSNAADYQGVFKPTNNGKHYESSYSYHKEWEKHDTKPSVVLPMSNPIPKNSELYDDSLTKQESQYNDDRYGQSLSHNSASSQSLYQSALNKQQSASTLNSNYVTQNQGLNSNRYSDMVNVATHSKPQSYQSSYSYHKSWERQGDPYIIRPGSNSIYQGQTAEKLTDAASSYNYDSSITNNQQDSSYKCLVPCEPRQSRVARSYGSDVVHMVPQNEDFGQQTQQLDNFGQESQNLEDIGQQTQQLASFGQQSSNLEDFGQQTQHLTNFEQQSQNLDLGQQTEQLTNFEQESQTLEDMGQRTQQIESFGQQSQNVESIGQQTQQVENFGQESQNLEDIGQQTQQLASFGQQAQSLEDFGQQTQHLTNFEQQSQNGEDIGQQTQKLESFGQQSQNVENIGQETQQLENFGQQSQNFEDLGQQTQQLVMFGHQAEHLEDYGQQTQQLHNFDQQFQKPDSTLEQKSNNNNRAIESLSNLWGKIDNLDGYYETQIVDEKESQKTYHDLHEKYFTGNFKNDTQNFEHNIYDERERTNNIIKQHTEKTMEDNEQILPHTSLNESNYQHTTDTTTRKIEKSYSNIGRGDIEDQPEPSEMSKDTLDDNTNHMPSGITTEQYILEDISVFEDSNKTNTTSTIIINNKVYRNEEQKFSDQQFHIEQETWTLEQQNADQRFYEDINQQSQNINDFGQENVNQGFIDFSQQSEYYLHSNIKDKNKPEFEPLPLDLTPETEIRDHKYNKNRVEVHKNEEIVIETDQKPNETHQVTDIEKINRLYQNATEKNILTATTSPTTESSSFWKNVGNKFKNAKDKIASWF